MSSRIEDWWLLQSGAGPAGFNMAFDEVLLRRIAELQHPVLRFYSWTGRAASFGYFQKHADIAAWTRLRPIVRRPTGGGLVSHDADWTYSLVFPTGHAWHSLRAKESYQRVHEWLRDAFHRLNVDAALAPKSRAESPGQCFTGFEESDVLWQGKKIAGAAQRRTKAGLLIQGSIQPSLIDLAKADWQVAVLDVAVSSWDVRWRPLELDSRFSRWGFHNSRQIFQNTS